MTEEAEVILRVYDVNGELVTMLQNGWLPAGEYEREFFTCNNRNIERHSIRCIFLQFVG
ncbi:MAG: hypothetical protein IPG53_12185 [Ignavibacteriales bacterium]|nr:hypothetical protein [Ignavibacteriales bacterium]